MQRKLSYWASILVVGLLLTVSALAADSITALEAGEHIGETKTVCGTVASAHFATHSRGHPTFLNLDRPYPDHIFTVVIWGKDRFKFPEPPEVMFEGKMICVTGNIRPYRGRPQIFVSDLDQIKKRDQ